MAYKFKYNERPRSYSEEKHGDEDIPSAKAVRDTATVDLMKQVIDLEQDAKNISA